MYRRWLTLACTMLLSGLATTSLCLAQSAEKPQPLQQAMAQVAGKMAAAIKGLKQDSISIGRFDGPPQLETSSGPGIAKVLADELAKHDITVKKRAELGLKGSFHTKRTEQNRLAAHINGEMFDSVGQSIFTFSHDVGTAQDLTALLGLTVELAADKPEKQRETQIEESIKKPQVQLADARVKASSTSPYALELHVQQSGKYVPRPAINDEGLAFAKIDRGETYGILVVNDSPLAAAVTITVDGVNVFAFSQFKQYKHYIIGPNSKALIKGWHRSNEVSDSFQVGDFSKSVAAKLLPDGGSIGTITATFAAAWPQGTQPPADELAARLTRGETPATIPGPAVEQKFTEVRMHTGVVRSAISIRYSKPDDLPPAE